MRMQSDLSAPGAGFSARLTKQSGRLVGLGLLLIMVAVSPPVRAQAGAAQTGSAQAGKNRWENLQRLKPGSKLSIKSKTGQKYRGKFVVVTDDAITLTEGGGRNVEVKREEIAEIRRKSGAMTAGYAAILGGLGFAAGYGVGYGIGEATRAGFAVEYPIAVMGAAAGAVVGAIIGRRGEVIYKAP